MTGGFRDFIRWLLEGPDAASAAAQVPEVDRRSSARTPTVKGENRLAHELNELRKSYREQTRTLERQIRLNRESEDNLASSRKLISTLEGEISGLRRTIASGAAREKQQEAEAEALEAQIASVHATLAARDAAVASLEVEQEQWKARLTSVEREIAELKEKNDQLKQQAQKLAEKEAAHQHLRLEFEALSARWDVAREQLAEAEQALLVSQAIIKAAQRLSSSVEWRNALDGVLDAASELVRFERGTLALVDDLQEELKIEAAKNSPIAVSEMSRFKVGEGIAGWALSHKEAVLVRDSRNDPRFKASDPRHDPRSFLAVPLLAGGEGLGVLTVARPATDPFNDHDLRSLVRVATDAANALINARLVSLLKQREGQLSTLVEKARQLAAAGEVQQVVSFAVTTAIELVKGEGGLLALRSSKTQDLEVLGSQGIPDDLLRQRIAWGAPAAADVIRTGKPWVAPMREMLPANIADQVEKAGMRALVSVRCASKPEAVDSDEEDLLSRSELEEGEDVIGVLNIYRKGTEPVSAGQLEQLRAFVDQVALAIKNARRWEKVRNQLQATASMNTRLMGRERYIHQLHFRIQQLEQELSRYKAA
jgi:GAF domain-containing protein